MSSDELYDKSHGGKVLVTCPCDPPTRPPTRPAHVGVAQVMVLLKLLEQAAEADEKVLLFSQALRPN
eukprot:5206219-Prymnesium_polylepis.1